MLEALAVNYTVILATKPKQLIVVKTKQLNAGDTACIPAGMAFKFRTHAASPQESSAYQDVRPAELLQVSLPATFNLRAVDSA